MGLLINICSLVLLFSLVPLGVAKDKLGSRKCEDLGFSELASCSDCNTLAEYVNEADLVSACSRCCIDDYDHDDSFVKITYSSAVLEVCLRKLVFYPEIAGFIEEETDQFPTVNVRYVLDSPPKLIMLDETGQDKEIIRIDDWEREDILQFLELNLDPTSAF